MPRLTNAGRQKVKEKATLAKEHRAAFARFFRMQGLMVLDKLESMRSQFRAGPLPADANKAWDALWTSVEQDTFDDLQKTVLDAEQAGMLAGGHYEQGKWVKGNKFWDLKNPRAVAWFKENGGSVDYIKGINDTTSELVKGVIGRGLDEGQSYNEIAKGIRAEFDGMTRDRATRIAVFETGQAYEAGNRAFVDSIVDDGIEMEEAWVTSHDEKVRPEHAANEAEGWVELGHVFSSGDTEPPTDPGCRCYMQYREKESK